MTALSRPDKGFFKSLVRDKMAAPAPTLSAGFSEPIISGRLGKLGALTSLYYDHYFVLDEFTLQYESSSGSGRMKSWTLDELQDCVRLPNKRTRGGIALSARIPVSNPAALRARRRHTCSCRRQRVHLCLQRGALGPHLEDQRARKDERARRGMGPLRPASQGRAAQAASRIASRRRLGVCDLVLRI